MQLQMKNWIYNDKPCVKLYIKNWISLINFRLKEQKMIKKIKNNRFIFNFIVQWSIIICIARYYKIYKGPIIEGKLYNNKASNKNISFLIYLQKIESIRNLKSFNRQLF
jgi:hypothetical protein